ncbi:hypothetical protein B566_EDAN000938 [Ephemera danica]|nr:hypothetical protein B566_EDAN000938 [Ephemera danica]
MNKVTLILLAVAVAAPACVLAQQQEGYERQYNSKHFVFFSPNQKKDLKLQCHYTTLTDGAATCNDGNIRVVKEPVCGKNCPKETKELTCYQEGSDGVHTLCTCKNNCNDFLVECSNGAWIFNATDCTDAANYSVSSVDSTRPDGKISYLASNNGANSKVNLRCSYETLTEGTAECKNGKTTIITKPICGAKCRRETEDLICNANSEEVEGGTICTCKKNCKRDYIRCKSGAWEYNPDVCKASYSEYKPSIQKYVTFTTPQSYTVHCSANPKTTLQNGTATCLNAELTVVKQPLCDTADGRQ